MCSQRLCNIAYAAALFTHSLYGLPVLVVQTLILSFCHVLCSFPSSFAFYGKKISVSEFLRSARSSFLLFPIKKENRQRLYNLLSIFILKLINFHIFFTIFFIAFFYQDFTGSARLSPGFSCESRGLYVTLRTFLPYGGTVCVLAVIPKNLTNLENYV